MAQDLFYELDQKGLGAIPLIDHFINGIGLPALLKNACKHQRYTDAILLLLKNIIIDRHALYAIHEWSAWYDPSLTYGGKIGDDTIARALDRLYDTDRASLSTSIVMSMVSAYDIDISQIHQDTTTVKMTGAYKKQNSKATQLKRGHSKDHRPDLKQLVYSLSVSRDGAIPIHFKAYDGNRTDDTLHWDTWLTLRGILGRSDFLYVGDSKLCTKQTLMNIDTNQGRFITMLPRTRGEVKQFNEKLMMSNVRWDKVYSKRSSRSKKIDRYENAAELYQMREGFRIHWFRSSEKKTRDHDQREEKIEIAMSHLRALTDSGRKRKVKKEKSLAKKADEVLVKFGVKEWICVDITSEKVEEFKQLTRGRSTEKTSYRKVIQSIPRITCRRNHEGIAQSEIMDGTFPLATNTDLKPLDVLKSYKYQPTLEKRHSMMKSVLEVAPVYLKKNDRIEALMFVYFVAQMISSLVERQIRTGMVKAGKDAIQVLPEDRPSKQPTTTQIFRLFQHQARRMLYLGKKHMQTFTEPLTATQKEILNLLGMPESIYA
jgi:transposase